MTDHDGLYSRVDSVEKRVDKHDSEIGELEIWRSKMEKLITYVGLFLAGFLLRNPEIIERAIMKFFE